MAWLTPVGEHVLGSGEHLVPITAEPPQCLPGGEGGVGGQPLLGYYDPVYETRWNSYSTYSKKTRIEKKSNTTLTS